MIYRLVKHHKAPRWEEVIYMNIHQITFSPTGGTRRVSESICKAFDVESYITELCTKQENLKYPDRTTATYRQMRRVATEHPA